jgi:hypothetical protein
MKEQIDMKGYHEPSYQDRMGRAAEAKQKALDLLKARPAVDEATLAVRRAAALDRQAAQAEKRAARKAVSDRAAAAKAEEQASAPTQEERKAARDARYAARKSRK